MFPMRVIPLRPRTNVQYRGKGDLSASVSAYELPEVLVAHAGSIRVVHTLQPLGVAMAANDVIDPYKD